MYNLNGVIQFNSDINGGLYLSINVDVSCISDWLDYLKKITSEIEFYSYTYNQQNRDGNKYHITVINPKEFEKFIKKPEKIEPFIGYPLGFDIYGIGNIKENNNEAYFLVCKSPEVQKIRRIVGLKSHDLHITLGYKYHDIFDKPKNTQSLIYPFCERCPAFN